MSSGVLLLLGSGGGFEDGVGDCGTVEKLPDIEESEDLDVMELVNVAVDGVGAEELIADGCVVLDIVPYVVARYSKTVDTETCFAKHGTIVVGSVLSKFGYRIIMMQYPLPP